MKFNPLIFSLLLFASCGDLVRFEVPQPEGQRDEKSIPRRLTGTYQNPEDSSVLIITNRFIIQESEQHVKGALADLDSADRLMIKRDTSFIEMNEFIGVPARIDLIVKGDSIYEHILMEDTLLNLLKGDVLRKFKGYYFLNEKIKDDHWRVTKIGRTKYGITLGTITVKEDLENLKELTNALTDSVYNFRPTKKQFKEFIKDGGFRSEKLFLKIK